uniref:Uncharacterized protein n=1 Tax=Rhizophora mucronata TaxID=61149 RepID=A0A2P2QDK3_RHIMU
MLQPKSGKPHSRCATSNNLLSIIYNIR